MSFLNNIRLKSKLFTVVGFLILLSIAISAIVYSATQAIVDRERKMTEAFGRHELAAQAVTDLLSFLRNVEFLPLEMPAEKRKGFEDGAEADFRNLMRRMASLTPAAEAGRIERDRFVAIMAGYQRDVHQKVQPLSRDGKFDDATRIAFEGAEKVEEARRLLASLARENLKIYEQQSRALGEELQSLLRTIILVASIGGILGLLAAFTTIVAGITRPLMRLIQGMQALAAGRTQNEIEGTQRRDEIGMMAQTVAVFRENALERARLEGEMRRERDMEKARQVRVEVLITAFRSSIGEIRQTLEGQLKVLQSSSTALGHIAEEASQGAQVAGTATSESSENVAQVASAASELTAASREISTQVHKASESVMEAMMVALSASMLVCSAMELMSTTMAPMRSARLARLETS
jgi:methyl-accepting chemotaxis protein